MQTAVRLSVLASTLTTTTFALPAFIAAHAVAQVELAQPTEVDVDAPITAVTLYRGRAMVTRTCALPDGQGTFEVRIGGLPPAVDPDSLTARVTGAKVLDVRYGELALDRDAATAGESKALMQALADARLTQQKLDVRLGLLNDRAGLLAAIASRMAGDAAKDFGSKSLDLEALIAQEKYVADSRATLAEERLGVERDLAAVVDGINSLEARIRALGDRSKVAREAVVTLGKSQSGTATLALDYLVSDAGWEPRYAVRATDAGDDALDLVTIEMNAEIMQRTGEDWSNVALTLSTAEPERRPEPPEVEPEFLAVAQPVVYGKVASETGRPAGPGGGGLGTAGTAGAIGSADAGFGRATLNDMLDLGYADAEGVGGAVVNYAIPRKVTVPSDGSRSRTQRVASFDLKPEFTHVVHPIADTTVYLRAKVRNTTGTQLVAGEARIFVGDDSVGSTDFPEVAPGGEMTLWLGGDARYEARRMLVEKDLREQGVFGKDDVTAWKWRIDVTSGARGATQLEVVDRVPVSRDEKVKIELKDLSMPLSTDAKYLADDRPRGILRWSFAMPGIASDGKPSTKSISWTVRQSVPAGMRVVPAAE